MHLVWSRTELDFIEGLVLHHTAVDIRLYDASIGTLTSCFVEPISAVRDSLENGIFADVS